MTLDVPSTASPEPLLPVADLVALLLERLGVRTAF